MNDYGLWAVLAGLELFGIVAVANPFGLMEWLSPKIKPSQYPEMKPVVKFIGWSFIFLPFLILAGFYVGRKP
jgi:hypothetical protein